MSTTPDITGTADPDLAELAASWSTHLAAENKSPGTRRVYLGGLAAFTAWHTAEAAPGTPVTLACLDRKTARLFLADILSAGASPATARSRYAALRQFSRWLAAEGETDGDVLAGLRPPRPGPATVDGITDDQLAALLRACRVPASATRWEAFEAIRDEAILRLLADTGCRAGEVVALTVTDVDLARRVATITRAKGNKRRISPFSAQTARALDRYIRKGRRQHRLAATSPLFLGTANRAYSYHALRGTMVKRAQLAGVKGFHAHQLRHRSASAALDAGISEGDVMAMHGWASRQILDRYVADTAQRRAASTFAQYFDERDRKDRR